MPPHSSMLGAVPSCREGAEGKTDECRVGALLRREGRGKDLHPDSVRGRGAKGSAGVLARRLSRTGHPGPACESRSWAGQSVAFQALLLRLLCASLDVSLHGSSVELRAARYGFVRPELFVQEDTVPREEFPGVEGAFVDCGTKARTGRPRRRAARSRCESAG